MEKRDKRVDQYIAKSADFAKPILTYLRQLVHETCPDCEETLKWNSPTFMYHGMLCGFAAFKEHATFGFWKHTLLIGDRTGEAMGSFGRLTSVKDLPPKKELVTLIKKAMKLNEEGVKVERMKGAPKKAIPVPTDLKAALAANKKASATFKAFPPSARRDYLEWITEAKSEATRERRLETAVGWMAEGKRRHWQYMP